ncbi:MAG: SH3 domain-containing protein [bacterium]|nr:SH3 domain-containing protein [bacterium]
MQYDDVLNLRAAPGADQPILAGLAPTYANMIAQGNARMLPSSFWYEVDANGTVGWVSARFIAYLGATDDYTSRVVADVGAIPSAETMLELADIVADSLKSQEEPESRITVTMAPVVDDLGEVTIDIIGFGDDALFGIRVLIFGQPDANGDSFSLMAAEATSLCGRGVTTDGLCV